MMHSISLIAFTPADKLAEAEAFANGPSLSEFTVALGDPPTHYYLHAWITPEEAERWQTEAPEWLIVSTREGGEPAEHFEQVMSDHSL